MVKGRNPLLSILILNNKSNKPPVPNKFLIPKPMDKVGISIGKVKPKIYHFFPLILARVNK